MTATTAPDIGRRAYLLEWGKLIFGSAWFPWIVIALITLVSIGPSYAPAVVTQYLPGAKPAVMQPTMGDLHALLVDNVGAVAYCKQNIEQALAASKNPLQPPRAPTAAKK